MASPLERGSCEQGKLPEDEAGGDMVQPRCDNGTPAAGVGCVATSGGSTVAIEALAGPAPLEATALSYVSLITSDSFLPGVQVLVHSLRSTGTRHPIHIMATPQVSRGARRRVRSFGATVLSVRSGCHVPGHAAVCQRLNAGGVCLPGGPHSQPQHQRPCGWLGECRVHEAAAVGTHPVQESSVHRCGLSGAGKRGRGVDNPRAVTHRTALSPQVARSCSKPRLRLLRHPMCFPQTSSTQA